MKFNFWKLFRRAENIKLVLKIILKDGKTMVISLKIVSRLENKV